MGCTSRRFVKMTSSSEEREREREKFPQIQKLRLPSQKVEGEVEFSANRIGLGDGN